MQRNRDRERSDGSWKGAKEQGYPGNHVCPDLEQGLFDGCHGWEQWPSCQGQGQGKESRPKGENGRAESADEV